MNPPARMSRMGFTFQKKAAAKLPASSAHALQSAKFSLITSICGIHPAMEIRSISIMAAAPISPATAGRRPLIMSLNRVVWWYLLYKVIIP